MMPQFSLVGKVALITGARRGIGKAIALAFAEAGANVAIADLEIADGELARNGQSIEEMGRRALVIQADITRKEDVNEMAQRVTRELGGIDILVNNAGILIRSRTLDTPEADWDRIIATNLKGPFLCSQVVGRIMVRQKSGCIINIASERGYLSSIEFGAYCVAKAGEIMLSRVLARELGVYGIRVNAIAPNMVKTEMMRFRWSDDEEMEKRLREIPLGRIAVPEDIARAAVFLASDAASYITGHTIIVDGGQIA
jgi:NAD(P)-dependent dehydrogenase (short-subunit alcohol dehydrogenase family)